MVFGAAAADPAAGSGGLGNIGGGSLRRMMSKEHDEQSALFQWAALSIGKYPALEMLYAIPNGGHRHKAVASRLKTEGVKAGVWDISLDVARGDYHGLKIEMKAGRNKLQPAQIEWQERYIAYGYKTAVCYSWIDAVAVITEYLQLPIRV